MFQFPRAYIWNKSRAYMESKLPKGEHNKYIKWNNVINKK